MNIDDILREARNMGASDVHINMQVPPVFRINGILQVQPQFATLNLEKVIEDMLSESQQQILNQYGSIDMCYAQKGLGRFRVNVYYERGGLLASAIRILKDEVPTIDGLDLPQMFKGIASYPRGLVLVTGPTGSGKSTTLAAIIDYINSTSSKHIISIEDPIEYMHRNKKSLISQREVGMDVSDVNVALTAALRQDPDVIMVGEMRDYSTISIALTAAETGHLVLATLHTTGVVNTIDRIINVFPPEGQGQIRGQLSMVLRAVVSQQLVPTKNHSARVSVNEVMIITDAIASLIRESKTHMISSYMTAGVKAGMTSLDASLANLVKTDTISEETAFEVCASKETLAKYLGR